MKRGMGIIKGFFLLAGLWLLYMPLRAQAINLENSPYIMVESYELSDEKIVPGEDFTLSLTLKNYSVSVTARDVLVNVENPGGIAPVYGTVSQTWVDEMGPGETATVSFDYTSSVEITGDYLDFSITMIGGSTANYITLRAPVGSDTPFSVMAYQIPEQITVGEYSSASISFRVLGSENVRNVAVEFTLDGETASRSTIGILTAGATRTQGVSVTAVSPGQYEGELILHYDDEADQNRSVVVAGATVTVLPPAQSEPQEPVVSPTPAEAGGSSEIFLLGIGGILILSVFVVVLLWARKKR